MSEADATRFFFALRDQTQNFAKQNFLKKYFHNEWSGGKINIFLQPFFHLFIQLNYNSIHNQFDMGGQTFPLDFQNSS